MNLSSVALVAAILVLVGLGSYAAFLASRLRQQRVETEQAQIELAKELSKKEIEARQSVQIIARALVQKDLSETEAAMRIAWLSQQINLSVDEAQHVSVFTQLAGATAHIPILDDWAALSKSEKRRLNAERESIESNYREFIYASAEDLTAIQQTVVK